MGVDIHLSILRDGQYLFEDIFDGRNTEWFNNLQGTDCAPEYMYFPSHCGIPKECPEDIKKKFKADNNDNEYFGYYGFNYITVKDYLKWYEEKKPYLNAGWVETYDKWLYEAKGIIPEAYHYLPEDANINDWHFIVFNNTYDCNNWLKNFILENKVLDNDIIVYYFDC